MGALSGYRILVVEDVPESRQALIALLTGEGADVAATANGNEAIRTVAERDIDILLTDLVLPDVDGDTLIRRSIEAARRRPRVVVVTGAAEPWVERARDAGADVILQKPINWTALVNCLRTTEQR